AQTLASGLDSPFLIVKDNQLEAAFTYAGDSPLMRLDEQGNAVYYLTDAMGSTIGLVDGSGVEVAEFDYDSFGNLRRSVGNDLGVTGGDFRFQGQWLESNTDLYHMRARYYDPESGRFVSRDPVEVIEYEPQSSNPYQFVYHNPHIYSDPSGMFSISELTSARQIQNVLQGIKAEISQRSRQFLIDKAQGVAGDIAMSVIQKLLPTSRVFSAIPAIESGSSRGRFFAAGIKFEDIVVGAVCDVILGNYSSFLQHFWMQPRVSTRGNPVDDGFACGSNIPNSQWFFQNRLFNPRPDFIIKDGGPRTTDKNPKAYLIGDIKLSGNAIVDSLSRGQWSAIMNYAKYGNRHQYTPVALYITFWAATASEQRTVEREAFSNGVSAAIISIMPNPRN
ncbi:MAG: RHS repeat-associated core domain-containing protein, partial [Kamptonema sp. SIO1D9]|nr:RHS repeat-associated core domain-containing protein [Kamptonema sp. SIO1D9]